MAPVKFRVFKNNKMIYGPSIVCNKESGEYTEESGLPLLRYTGLTDMNKVLAVVY